MNLIQAVSESECFASQKFMNTRKLFPSISELSIFVLEQKLIKKNYMVCSLCVDTKK